MNSRVENSTMQPHTCTTGGTASRRPRGTIGRTLACAALVSAGTLFVTPMANAGFTGMAFEEATDLQMPPGAPVLNARAYRVYAEFNNVNDRVFAIRGNPGIGSPHRLTMSDDGGGGDIKDGDLRDVSDPLDLDDFTSYWTIGTDAEATVDSGFPNANVISGAGPTVYNIGAEGYFLPGGVIVGLSLRVLVAQFVFDGQDQAVWFGTIEYLDGGKVSREDPFEAPIGPAEWTTPEGPRMLVLMDRSGSMNQSTPPRCLPSVLSSGIDITAWNNAYDPPVNEEVSIWTFRQFQGAPQIENLSTGSESPGPAQWVTPTQANIDLGTIGACGGWTPLADALCVAVDELDGSNHGDHKQRLLLSTDGKETAFANPGSVVLGCIGTGPSASPVFPWTAGSWQDIAYTNIMATDIEVVAHYWTPCPAGGCNSPLPPPVDYYMEFLERITDDSGGYLTIFYDGQPFPEPIGGCCLGDGQCIGSVTVLQCNDMGGAYQGNYSSCFQCQDNNCRSDIDGNGVTGIVDLLSLLGFWGPCPDSNSPCAIADLDHNGTVDIIDLLLCLGSWGPCP